MCCREFWGAVWARRKEWNNGNNWNNGNWVNKSSEAQKIIDRTQKLYVTNWNPAGIYFLVRKMNDRMRRHTVGQKFSIHALRHPWSLGLCWRNVSPLHKTALCSRSHKLCREPDIPLDVEFHCITVFQLTAFSKAILLQIKSTPSCTPSVDMQKELAQYTGKLLSRCSRLLFLD